jgi:hypothetical protein
MRGERYLSESARYSGRLHERDLFGEVTAKTGAADSEFKRAIEAVKDGRVQRYQKFDDAIKDVMRHSNQDPLQTKPGFLKDLRIEVANRLAAKRDEDVLAWSAVGTPLDVLHGADAFLVIRGRRDKEIITLDASLRDKLEAKTDIVVGDIPDPETEEDAYLRAVERYAEAAIEIIRSRARLTGTDG